MTREQAKREIDSLDFYLQNHTDDYGEESHTAMMMAIKALEQQTCEDAVSRKDVLNLVDNLNDGSFRWASIRTKIARLHLVQPELKPCEDAISRQAVLELFAQNADAVRPYSKTWEEVKALPSVNSQPKTKTGHWIDCGSYYRCSECDNWVDEVDGMPKFCDECGAKMVEPQESEEV